MSNRAALTGIVFILKTGLPWEYLPQEMGCGPGMTCWRRLKEWQEAGVRDALHRVLLERLHQAGVLDWSRAALDSSSLRAVGVSSGKENEAEASDQTPPTVPVPAASTTS